MSNLARHGLGDVSACKRGEWPSQVYWQTGRRLTSAIGDKRTGKPYHVLLSCWRRLRPGGRGRIAVIYTQLGTAIGLE